MIHVIIPVYNRLKKTITCLKSLEKQNIYKDLRIIIVNDGSNDGTKKYITKNFPQINIINGDGSLFWGGAIKLGIEYVLKKKKTGDWILILNNDIELTPETISRLISISEINKKKSLVIPLTLNAKDRKTIIKSGTLVKSWFLNITKHVFVNMEIDQIKNKQPIVVDIFTGRCVLHPIEMFEITGNYDATNFKHYGCDDEFSLRVKKFGYSILLCPSSIIFLTENEKFIEKKISFQNFLHVFFNIKSSSNIINKFKLTLKVIPMYAKLSFFFIGILKSFYIFLRKKY